MGLTTGKVNGLLPVARIAEFVHKPSQMEKYLKTTTAEKIMQAPQSLWKVWCNFVQHMYHKWIENLTQQNYERKRRKQNTREINFVVKQFKARENIRE